MSGADACIGGVVLAAGGACRFGSAKQALPLQGEPMLRRVARQALAAPLSPVVVVTGAHREAVLACLDGLDVLPADNAAWAEGMGGSIAIGVTAAVAAVPSLSALLVMLGDQPSIDAGDLQGLLAMHRASPQAIIAARYDGHLGAPCLFPRDCFGELQALRGPQGARALLERHAGRVRACDLPAAAFDIDTPADHAAWLARQPRD